MRKRNTGELKKLNKERLNLIFVSSVTSINYQVDIMGRWQELLSLLEVHRDKLERYSSLISLQREIDTLATTIKYIFVVF